ncbi:MAG: hypothetical protein HYY50_04905 [Candidatus Kerfeldbacteria bacterium]|nr:hypothetical protein [Candidatus Kerfeldbacteria bacterium]
MDITESVCPELGSALDRLEQQLLAMGLESQEVEALLARGSPLQLHMRATHLFGHGQDTPTRRAVLGRYCDPAREFLAGLRPGDDGQAWANQVLAKANAAILGRPMPTETPAEMAVA